MGRILAIDYGSKRCGIAVTDPLRLIATALTTVHSAELIAYLKQYASQEQVDMFVVGEPKQLNNDPAQSHEMIQNFCIHLGRQFPNIPIHRMDERFTSSLAKHSLIQSGVSKKKRQDKSLVDQISATIILQDFLKTRPV